MTALLIADHWQPQRASSIDPRRRAWRLDGDQ
jgi:hypothetical protein